MYEIHVGPQGGGRARTNESVYCTLFTDYTCLQYLQYLSASSENEIRKLKRFKPAYFNKFFSKI